MTTLQLTATLIQAQIGPSGPTAPPGADKFNTLASWVMWGVVLLLVIAAMAAAGKLAWDKGHGGGMSGEGGSQLGKVAIAAVVVASAVAIVNTLVI